MKRRILQPLSFAMITAFACVAASQLEAATFHFLGGIQDNYALPTEPINPSPSLQTFLGTNTYSSYDTFSIDQRFADTFAQLPMCITQADLHIAMRPLAGVGQSSATNDTLRFNFTNNAGQQVGPYWIEFIGYQGQEALLQTDWGSQNFYPNGVNFWLDLGAMPIGNFNFNGNTANLIPAMNLYKHLNVDVQDDTEVDYIDLRIVTALGGDMNGDGCVDAADLTLLATNFNQPTPAGLGDPDGNGVIDINDFSIVQADFGKCCPEPTSVALLVLGLCGVVSCGTRRRTQARVRVAFFVRAVTLTAFAIGAATLSPATSSAQDYNGNAFVDAADYTVWQDNLGATVVPFAGADGDGSSVVDFADYAVWYNSFSTSPLSPSQSGGPTLSIVDIGLDVNLNRKWSVRIDPDDALFTDPPDSPDRGVGGSVAAEVAFEVVTGTLVSVSKNAVDFSFDNPGNSPFGFNSSPDYGVSLQGNQIFAALGSEYFGASNYGASAGLPKEMLVITTLGAAKTKIMWSGVYGPNGDQGRLAQAGINFDTAGMAMAGVPEPGSATLLALGVIASWLKLRRRRDRFSDGATAAISAILVMLCLLSPTQARAVTIATVPVGNAGNAADSTGFGAVAYPYRIAMLEVSNAQYVEFLNAVDLSGANTLSLYNNAMMLDARGGIDFNSGAANGSKYSAKSGRANNPVVFVSRYDGHRFANWMHNGQGGGTTESGAYTLLGGTPIPSNSGSMVRNANAQWFIPTSDEWYKAAYHKNDGVTGNYWDYPTSTDTTPFSAPPPGSAAPAPSNTANFFNSDNLANGYDDGFAVNGSVFYNPAFNYLTDVGAYPAALSPYGTLDQGGNVAELSHVGIFTATGRLRGGAWFHSANDLSVSMEFQDGLAESFFNGFRLATPVPEPATLVLLMFATVGWRFRRRRSAY